MVLLEKRTYRLFNVLIGLQPQCTSLTQVWDVAYGYVKSISERDRLRMYTQVEAQAYAGFVCGVIPGDRVIVPNPTAEQRVNHALTARMVGILYWRDELHIWLK